MAWGVMGGSEVGEDVEGVGISILFGGCLVWAEMPGD
jgi:hypothetical protein